MASRLARALALLGFLHLSQCVSFEAPHPTQLLKDVVGFTPKPTEAPSPQELKKRQLSVGANTCGWQGGSYGGALSCNSLRTCVLYEPENQVGMAGCCLGSNYQDCGWSNQCLDYEAIQSNQCDLSCSLNDFIRKCSNIASPYCRSWTYPGPAIADFGCGTDPGSSWVTMFTEISDIITTSLDMFVVPEAAVTGWEITTGSLSATRSSRTTASDVDFVDQTATADSTDSTSSLSPTSVSGDDDNNDDDDSGTPVGAIVGGVVGGVAVLAIIGGLLAFFLLRKRKNKNQSTAPTATPAMTQQSPHPNGASPYQQSPPVAHQQQYQQPHPAQDQYFAGGPVGAAQGQYGQDVKGAGVQQYPMSPQSPPPPQYQQGQQQWAPHSPQPGYVQPAHQGGDGIHQSPPQQGQQQMGHPERRDVYEM
ncbi:hypothetical protein M501DRAFT_1061102 [Patellaria atrata CBS 101060]|uniref:Mid2 domain-containing protein n=1 Tax=Patellaria atrata CBS 101060 TaxID=1346257 RepID=A0A9P4S2R6_9PEZI|nr:hypothetical protein M501DRAFT_1061102 [Patellaria atrata CBS 101060]